MILIPFLWSLIGVSAAINLSVKQDYFLVLAGIVSTAVFFFRREADERKIDAAAHQQ